MTCEMLLEFHGKSPELIKTLFRENGGEVRLTLRGKTPGAQRNAGTFQWTSAVRALCIAVLRGRLSLERNQEVASLSGFAGSLAATLDYAISKQPTWTEDMFGVTPDGRSVLRRVISRSNSERKRPGPVTLSLNPHVLSPGSIIVWWNGQRVQEPTVLKGLIDSLELQTNANYHREPREKPLEAFFKRGSRAA